MGVVAGCYFACVWLLSLVVTLRLAFKRLDEETALPFALTASGRKRMIVKRVLTRGYWYPDEIEAFER